MLAAVLGPSSEPGDYVLDGGACLSSPYEPPDGEGTSEFFTVASERIPVAMASDAVE